MKTKRVKRTCASVAVLIATLTILLSSCAEKPDMQVDTHQYKQNLSTQMLTQKAEYGSYIYFSDFMMYKYDKRTGVISRVCQDPECDGSRGSCPLDGWMVILSGIVDDKLFFFSMIERELYVKTFCHAYYDLITNKVTIIREGDFYDVGAEFNPVLTDEYVYYTYRTLRPGGDRENKEDYIRHACRQKISGGEEELICQLNVETNEQIIAATEQYLITYSNPNIHKYDLSTGAQEIIFDSKANGEKSVARFTLVDNWLYFLGSGNKRIESEYKKVTYANRRLMRMNLENGAVEKLNEVIGKKYLIDGDKIYFAEDDIRYMYIPDDYETNPDGVIVMFHGDTLYSCDLDGNNVQAVIQFPDTDFGFAVINGFYFGSERKFNFETHSWGKSHRVIGDLATGNLTVALWDELYIG